jgi:hypothetical protein
VYLSEISANEVIGETVATKKASISAAKISYSIFVLISDEMAVLAAFFAIMVTS